jgi:rubrerythrin
MGAVYSLFPSGYVQPTKTTTVLEIVDMPIEEQASFASKSVIMRADDAEFAKKLLGLPAPEPVTAEYLATLAAVIKTGGEFAAVLREKYAAAAGKQLADEPKDTVVEQTAPVENAPVEKITPAEQIIERFVTVHYCPSCGTIFRGSEEDESSSEEDSSTLSNSLD